MAKAIRTSEGIMAWAVGLATGIFSYIEGIEYIPHEVAAIVIAANAGLHIVSRTLLKIFALQKEVGIEAPITFEEGRPVSATVPDPGTVITPTVSSVVNTTLGQP